jgi:hypothetical protein
MSVTGPLVNLNDEIYEMIDDLETVMKEYEELDVQFEDAEDYAEYLAELRKRVSPYILGNGRTGAHTLYILAGPLIYSKVTHSILDHCRADHPRRHPKSVL